MFDLSKASSETIAFRSGGNNACKQCATSGAVLDSFLSAFAIKWKAVSTDVVQTKFTRLNKDCFYSANVIWSKESKVRAFVPC